MLFENKNSLFGQESHDIGRLTLAWGCADFCRHRDGSTGRTYEISASGQICFTVCDAALFRAYFQGLSPECRDREALLFFLRDRLRVPSGAALLASLTESGYSSEELYELTSERKRKLCKIFYGKIKDVFSEYGLTVSPDSENAIIVNFVMLDR